MALFHWRRHLRKEKSLDSKSQEKVSTSEFKRGGGESFRKRMQKSERELLGRKWKKANQSRKMRNDVLHEKDLPTCKI